jgi:hypothetical protein
MLFANFIVGAWIPILAVIRHDPQKENESPQPPNNIENGQALERTTSSLYSLNRHAALKSALSPGLLPGIAKNGDGYTWGLDY